MRTAPAGSVPVDGSPAPVGGVLGEGGVGGVGVGVGAGATTTWFGSSAPLLTANAGVPEYVAVIVCVPAVRALVVKVALPVAFRTTSLARDAPAIGELDVPVVTGSRRPPSPSR